MSPSDAELLAASSRDPGAFRALYDRHADHIDTFFARRVGDPDVALDLTAETFARAWYARRRFRDRRDGAVAPWLYGIAKNVLRQSVRRQAVAREATQKLGILLAVDREPVAPDVSWVEGLDADVERALAELSDGQRRAVELRIAEDRSYEEVAVELGCSPGAARIRVSRALDILRRRVEEERR